MAEFTQLTDIVTVPLSSTLRAPAAGVKTLLSRVCVMWLLCTPLKPYLRKISTLYLRTAVFMRTLWTHHGDTNCEWEIIR